MHKNGLAPIIDHTRKILILGSMPGDQSIAKQQYYGNNGNHFWKIVFAIFNENFSIVYEDRKALLEKYHIALWTIIGSCKREGSSDSKISNEVINDLSNFHIQYPNIKYVFFESKTTARFFEKHIVPEPHIIYETLPSTSGLNAGTSLLQKIEQWKIVADIAKKNKTAQ